MSVEVPVTDVTLMTRMQCKRCGEFITTAEEHHIWPKFMDNPRGYSFEENPNKSRLCFNCHKKLHQEIIIPLLNDIAKPFRYNGSEHWLWQMIIPVDRPAAIKSVVEASIKFIFQKEENGITGTA